MFRLSDYDARLRSTVTFCAALAEHVSLPLPPRNKVGRTALPPTPCVV